MKKQIFLMFLFLSFSFFSCRTADRVPLGAIYGRGAKNLDRNPVIVIHGMGGAKLLERGTAKVVWGSFTSDAVALDSEQGWRDLSLPVWKGDILNVEDSLYACCPLNKVNFEIAGVHFSVAVYQKIMETLGVAKYNLVLRPDIPKYSQGCSCFTFFYDWRKDNVQNAIALGKFLENRAAMVRAKLKRLGIEKKEVKFDIVAHSMGGLLARYYLRYGTKDMLKEKNPRITWAGSKRIGRLFLVGPPNLGSVDALRALVEGEHFGPFLPNVEPALLATFPSMYQILPSPRLSIFQDEKGNPVKIDLYNPETWLKNGFGPFQENQKEIAVKIMGEKGYQNFPKVLKKLLDRAKRFHQIMEELPPSKPPTQIFLFASNTIPTLAKVRIKKIQSPGGAEKMAFFFQGRSLMEGGDGIVTFRSALGDIRSANKVSRLHTFIPWHSTYFFHGSHRDMVNSEVFRNNLLFLLLETPIILKQEKK